MSPTSIPTHYPTHYEDDLDSNDTLFLLICFLGVMVMQVGFALVEVGFVSNAAIKRILFKVWPGIPCAFCVAYVTSLTCAICAASEYNGHAFVVIHLIHLVM